MFLTAFEKFAKPFPKAGSCLPNVSKSLSPVNQDINPPVFGTSSANSAIALAASAPFFTASESTFLTDLENSDKLCPNLGSCFPNVSKSLSPVNQDINPPVFGISFANSTSILIAFMAEVTSLVPIEEIDSVNSLILGPNFANSSPNSDNEFPPNNKLPILSMKDVAVSAAIIAVKYPTLVTAFLSRLFIPSKKGFKFSMNKLRLSAISGKLSVNPLAIDPRKSPMHLPIILSISAPPFIRYLIPGISPIAPTIANTAMNSATKAPKPTRPNAAVGINGNSADKAATRAANPPAATIHFIIASGSILAMLSNIAVRAVPISLTHSSIILGRYFDKPWNTVIINSPSPSIIGPAYLASEPITSVNMCRIVFTISGITVCKLSNIAFMQAIKASAILGANSIIPSSANLTNSIIPSNAVVSDNINAAIEPATDVNPIPRTANAAPNRPSATDNAAKPPATANIPGAKGVKIDTAATNPISAAVKERTAIPNSAQLSSPNSSKASANIIKPAAAIAKLAAPVNDAFIDLTAITTAVKPAAIDTRPFAIPFHVNLDNAIKEPDNAAIPTDITTIEPAIESNSLSGIAAVNNAIDANIPANPVNPLESSSQLIPDNCFTAWAITNIPADNTVI